MNTDFGISTPNSKEEQSVKGLNPNHPARSQRRGVALILVLSSVSLLTLLVMGFLSLVLTEDRATTAFSEIVEARSLTDLPVNLVIAQIRKGTDPRIGTSNSNERTWASQPGMIRAYGTVPDPSTGNVRALTDAAYKLYSDDKMVWVRSGNNDTGLTTELQADANDLKTWNEKPGMYVDLNQPVPVKVAHTGQVRYEFPIVDPRAAIDEGGRPAVEGFSFNANGVNQAKMGTSRSDETARLPMPVKWIYILQNGEHVTPTTANATEATFDGPVVPTKDNPIVGRIAYWTDDESAKININTASEGTYWDRPNTNSYTDHQFATRIPVKNEYSRYPGHPASTSLSPVFQSFNADYVVGSISQNASDQTQRAKAVKLFHDLSPRLGWGGTEAGSLTLSDAAARKNITNKKLRLYSSIDELFLNQNRKVNQDKFNRDHLDLAKFFLTAHSRASELTLSGKPKVLLWPISKNAAHRNDADKLLAFLGTGANRTWYFQRESNFTDTSNPGSSQTFGDNNGENQRILRDYLYALTGSGGHDIPGFGSSFAKKWQVNAGDVTNTGGRTERNQILTMMFDLLRWGVNGYSPADMNPRYTYLPPRSGTLQGETSAIPVRMWNATRGIGRFPTTTEFVFVFAATQVARDGAGNVLLNENGDGIASEMKLFIIPEVFSPTSGPPSWSPNIRYLIANFRNGRAEVGAPFSLTVGSNQFPGTSLFNQDRIINRANLPVGYITGGHSTPFNGIGSMFYRPDTGSGDARVKKAWTSGAYHENNNYPFISNAITISDPINTKEFTLNAGELLTALRTGWGVDNSTDTLVQITNIEIPTARLKVPYVDKAILGDASALNRRLSLDDRIDLNKDMRDSLIVRGDITRSIEALAEIDENGNPSATGGDLRHLAALETVPIRDANGRKYFGVHPFYSNRPDIERLHFLRDSRATHDGQFGPADGGVPTSVAHNNRIGQSNSGNRAATHNTAGTLVRGMYYMRDCPPAVPRGLNGAFMVNNRPGDWDNGVGRIEDGPYINHPDQGNSATSNGGYLDRGTFVVEDGSTFSPNRQVASAVMFGSIPTGVVRGRPWQTLLFCPNPASRSTLALDEPTETDHEGFKAPRDHLMLDNFWMPIIEPYAMSESFSTAGKINMNYQIMPFSYIERSTGIHSVMKATKVIAITPRSVGGTDFASAYGNAGGQNYKEGTVHNYELRYDVDVQSTLDGFKNRFTPEVFGKTAKWDIFRSPSEICEIFLVPRRIQGASYNSDAKVPTNYQGMTNWWNGNLNAVDAFEGTGDNSRENPYNQLYPRLTTRSNTFRVYYTVQSLRKARSTEPNKWVEGRDTVMSESRGSTLLERYLDPNDKEIQTVMVGLGNDFANNSWEDFYRIRIISRRQFAP